MPKNVHMSQIINTLAVAKPLNTSQYCSISIFQS